MDSNIKTSPFFEDFIILSVGSTVIFFLYVEINYGCRLPWIETNVSMQKTNTNFGCGISCHLLHEHTKLAKLKFETGPIIFIYETRGCEWSKYYAKLHSHTKSSKVKRTMCYPRWPHCHTYPCHLSVTPFFINGNLNITSYFELLREVVDPRDIGKSITKQKSFIKVEHQHTSLYLSENR